MPGSTATFDVFDDPCDPNSPRYSLGSPTTSTDQLGGPDRHTAKTNRKVTIYPPIWMYMRHSQVIGITDRGLGNHE